MLGFATRINAAQAVQRLQDDSPLKALYELSCAGGKHFEGSDALEAVGRHKAELREQGVERCSDLELFSRIHFVEVLAADLFKQFLGVEGVVFYGSALRGKNAPGDIDVMVLTEAQDPNLKCLNVYSLKDYESTLVARIEQALARHDLTYRGVRVNATVEYAVNRFGGLLDLAAEGPFLAFVKTSKAGIDYFANTGFQKYREARAI